MAMSGTLRVDPDQLISTAGTLSDQAGAVQTKTNQMMDLVNNLTSCYESEDKQAFVSKFTQLEEDMQQIYKMISHHAEQLTEMAQNYKNTVNENTDTANALNTDFVMA